MQVVAFSTPTNPHWRWRIVNYAGEVVEESHEIFPTIASAVAQGTKRLVQMNVVDRSEPVRGYRSTTHEKPSVKRKRKQAQARKKRRRALQRARPFDED